MAFDNANADIYGFQIYKVALPNREIKRIYELTSIRETKQFTLTDSDLKLYYKFNDASSTIRNYGNYTDTGDNVRHRSFDGADDYISLPLSVKYSLHNTAFSVSFWWRPQSLSSSWRCIFESRDENPVSTNQAFTIQYRNNSFYFGFGWNDLYSSGFTPVNNTWYFVTFVYVYNTGKRLYINGSLNVSNTQTGALIMNSTYGTGMVSIGRDTLNSRYGLMDLSDFRIYTKALSATEVSTIYSAGKNYFSNTYSGSTISYLEYQYKLDSIDDVNDSAEKYSHGTNQGTSSVVDTDNNNVRYRSFDGTDDYISLPLSVKDSLHNTSFSVSFWIRPKETGVSNMIFAARNNSSSTTNQFLHLFLQSNRSFRFAFYSNDLDTTGFSYSTDVWYHIVCVYVYNTGKRIYINGSLNNSNSQTTALTIE